MGLISGFINKMFKKREVLDASKVEELRTDFRARYHQFKLLLTANNNALEIMTEMEEALKGTWPFGMNFVLSRCTSVSTNVWQIVRHLNELAPGRYKALMDRFKEIQKKINPIIRYKTRSREGPMFIPLKEVDKDMADQVGSKIANLGEMGNRINLKTSGGFAITAQAYYRFMKYNDLQAEIDRLIQTANAERPDQLYSLSAAIQQLIVRSALPEDLEAVILEQYRILEKDEGKGVKVAMRSSALGEDLAETSFAGQYRSELNVSGENILHAYKEIVASKYGLPAMTYRLNRGIRDEDVAMCVGCMSMVDAVSAGVMYSRSPLSIRDNSIVINSVWGLPKSVVDGSAPSDLFIISRSDPMAILRRDIPVKKQKFVCYPDEGICRLKMIDEEGKEASLTDEQAIELARLAVRLEDHCGVPQDIEWAITTDGSVVCLQCRPMQQMKEEKALDMGEIREEVEGTVILQGGFTASPGVAAGPVFIVKKDMDTLRFPKGAVLVTAQSLPRWATLLNRAAAVITGQGSIAGHLANVAREFGVPALFGVKDAVDLLEKDQEITVDADGLRIYEGRIDSLLKEMEKPRNLMEGSPVFKALEGASRHIIPLRLLDPDAPSFKTQNCKTFHDITRFCHEKAVHEMFRFGKEHHFPERSSKQLLGDVPMQWWILNLDDGFKDEEEGKYVRLENIVSIPMLALWKGIAARPWEGPPPVDGKGLMSVMFQATTNTALVPGVRSKYANRNYFMISKNYCSLNSRLGFHFSIVEALVSDRSSENYISFQFKGGAADFNRRQRRVFFVMEVLEEYGFRVDVNEDTLIARMENHEKDFMVDRLTILGYLTIHTRQLDMIMQKSASVNHYRSKIHKDIQEIVFSNQ